MIHKDLTLLYPPATLPNLAENKGAVMVGRKKISGGENNETCVCKEYDLVWGNKVNCNFRKRVIEISKKLQLPQEKNEGANWFLDSSNKCNS